MEFDQFVIDELRRVYGPDLQDFLELIKRPPERFYMRVNTALADPERVARKIGAILDEDLEEALYFPVHCRDSLEPTGDVVMVDGPTAESVMQGANVYKPGIKEIRAKSRRVSVVGPGGVVVAHGELVMSGGLMVKVTEPLCDVPAVRESRPFSQGLLFVQGKPSQFVARVVDPRPGELIVDATAAPGGKLSHLAQLEPRAKLVGFDRTQSKVSKLRENLSRLHLDVPVYRFDSRYLWESGLKDVDKILIDPPCSALGLRPKLYDHKDKEHIIRLRNYQLQFLEAAHRILRPGGELIYSTCTVTLLENEEVINDPRFELQHLIRFHPQVNGTGGFFIAKLKKRG